MVHQVTIADEKVDISEFTVMASLSDTLSPSTPGHNEVGTIKVLGSCYLLYYSP